MSCYKPDAYHQPEAFDLTIIGEIDDPDACYSFEMIVVWKHADGRKFYAQDAGCSCPSPFEDYTSIDSLTALTDETWPAFQAELDAWCDSSYKSKSIKDETAMLRTELTRKAAQA